VLLLAARLVTLLFLPLQLSRYSSLYRRPLRRFLRASAETLLAPPA
jgi:hypothetical protein